MIQTIFKPSAKNINWEKRILVHKPLIKILNSGGSKVEACGSVGES
jgi:hypothetical protein